LHNGGERNVEGEAALCIPLPALYIKKPYPGFDKKLRKFCDLSAAE